MSLKQRVKELIETKSKEAELFCSEMMEGNYNQSDFKELNVESVSSYGGEGEGDDFYRVYSFTDEDTDPVYVKFQGWYASYHGAEFTEWYFVEPKEKTAIVYNKA